MTQSANKILMISAEYPPALSGMGDYAFNLVTSLRALPELPEISVLNSWQLETVCAKVEELAPQIVHLQYLSVSFGNDPSINWLPFNLRKRFPRLRVVTTYHEFAAPFKRLFLLPLLWHSHAHLVTNDRHLEFVEQFKRFGILKGMAAKVPLASNVPLSSEGAAKRSQIRREMGLREDEFLWVRFGILHDVILPHLLQMLKVFRAVRAAGMPVRLLLTGKAELRAKHLLQEKIAEMKLEGIIFRNDLSHEDISEYLYASDFGLALYPDGVSEKRTALLALMEHGLPLIATQKGALPREFRNGENMLCVPVDASADTWLENLNRLVREKALRASLSRGALKAAALHQWGPIARQTFEVYRRVIAS